MIRQLALLVLLLALSFTPAAFGLPDEAVGRVVSVVSGDSLGIEILIGDARTNNIDSIKLADIQAPSTVTAEGKATQEYALSLLKNKLVYLDINDNATTTRNKWSQLICVIYLMDPEFRPVWPPVNRILVDSGYARLNDDPNNEFNSSAWWQRPSAFLPGEKIDLLKALLEKLPEPEQLTFVAPSSPPAVEAKVNTMPSLAKVNATTSLVKDSSTAGVAKVNSTASLVKGSSTVGVAKVNTTTSLVNGSSIVGVAKVNSTTSLVKVNSTASLAKVNTTTSLVKGSSTVSVEKSSSRKGSILEKDETSGRVSIGYRT